MSYDQAQTKPAIAPEADPSRGEAVHGSQTRPCKYCGVPFVPKFIGKDNEQLFHSDGCRYAWHEENDDRLHVGLVLDVVLDGFKIVANGNKYELRAVLNRKDAVKLGKYAADTKGAKFRAPIECVSIAK